MATVSEERRRWKGEECCRGWRDPPHPGAGSVAGFRASIGGCGVGWVVLGTLKHPFQRAWYYGAPQLIPTDAAEG